MQKETVERTDQCKKLIDAMGCNIDWIDNDIISVDSGLWQILVSEKSPDEICLSFHVNVCPNMAASIYKRLSYLADLIGMDVVLYEVYAFELDEDGRIKEVTFGQDAYDTVGREHYFGLDN
jgi:hypothetical protein